MQFVYSTADNIYYSISIIKTQYSRKSSAMQYTSGWVQVSTRAETISPRTSES